MNLSSWRRCARPGPTDGGPNRGPLPDPSPSRTGRRRTGDAASARRFHAGGGRRRHGVRLAARHLARRGVSPVGIAVSDGERERSALFGVVRDQHAHQRVHRRPRRLSPIGLSTIPEDGSLWLGLSIDGGVELSPRLQFGTAPYAARCAAAEDAQTLEGLGVVDIASSAAEALATDDVHGQNTVDTVNGDFDVDGEVLFSSTSDNNGVSAPVEIEDASSDDELLVDSDEIDPTSPLGLLLNTNTRAETRVGNDVLGGSISEEDEVSSSRASSLGSETTAPFSPSRWTLWRSTVGRATAARS